MVQGATGGCPVVTGWTWHWTKVNRTPGTLQRWWIASLSLGLTPEGKRAELRLHLKQWDDQAAEPRTWCLQLMKYGQKPDGHWDPWRPTNMVQISEKDWSAWFAAWRDGAGILAQLLLTASGQMPSRGTPENQARLPLEVGP